MIHRRNLLFFTVCGCIIPKNSPFVHDLAGDISKFQGKDSANVQQSFSKEFCIFPILGVLTTFLVKYLNAKANELMNKTNNEIADKYIAMICDTISCCVVATNQTYVNSLKE
jgi:hypothetical protein